MPLIERIDQPDLSVREAVMATMDRYNDLKTGRPDDYKTMAIFVRDEAGEIVGGLWAVMFYDWMHIDLLCLPEASRGSGLGRRMMLAMEREAVARGCVGIWVDTSTYQAPGFYAKLGYSVFARIDDYNPGSSRMWLSKRLGGPAPDGCGLQIEADPPRGGREAILNSLLAFNDSRLAPSPRHAFCLAVRDELGGPIRGGLLGRIGSGWLFVEILALPDDMRHGGVGTRLMRQAETITADEFGGRGVLLDTFSFQAGPFYERLGYHAYGVIPDYPGAEFRTLLARRLDGRPLLTDLGAATGEKSA